MSEPIHIIEWHGEDRFVEDEPGRFVIIGFGRNACGQTCSVSFDHLPSFLVRSAEHSLEGVLRAVTEIFGEDVHESSGTVHGKPFTKWQDHTEPFMRLVFTSKRAARYAAELFREPTLKGRAMIHCPPWFLKARLQYETYEADADPLLEALTTRGIPTTGWVTCDGQVKNPTAHQSRCEMHFTGAPVPLHDDDVPEQSAPHIIATFDIEVFSSRSTWEDSIFPDANIPGDVVTQIVTFFSKFGESEPCDAIALVLLGPGGKAPDINTVMSGSVPVRVQYFEREAALLRAWVKAYSAYTVSVWQHFNGLVGWQRTSSFKPGLNHQRG